MTWCLRCCALALCYTGEAIGGAWLSHTFCYVGEVVNDAWLASHLPLVWLPFGMVAWLHIDVWATGFDLANSHRPSCFSSIAALLSTASHVTAPPSRLFPVSNATLRFGRSAAAILGGCQCLVSTWLDDLIALALGSALPRTPASMVYHTLGASAMLCYEWLAPWHKLGWPIHTFFLFALYFTWRWRHPHRGAAAVHLQPYTSTPHPSLSVSCPILRLGWWALSTLGVCRSSNSGGDGPEYIELSLEQWLLMGPTSSTSADISQHWFSRCIAEDWVQLHFLRRIATGFSDPTQLAGDHSAPPCIPADKLVTHTAGWAKKAIENTSCDWPKLLRLVEQHDEMETAELASKLMEERSSFPLPI